MFRGNEISDDVLSFRREAVFLVLAGLFLGSLTMLNILGISRFLDLSFNFTQWTFNATLGKGHVNKNDFIVPFQLAIGVLPYPITFLCTDFISELYGRKRANLVVFVGLLLNAWVIFIMWLGGILPPVPVMDPVTNLPAIGEHGRVFFEIRLLTFGAVAASMIAYLSAQFCDVHIFHFLKKITKGKHLWLRNNGSTLVSQLVDSVAVILITHFYAHALPINDEKTLFANLGVFILSSYLFKMIVALIDTAPFYYGTKQLSKFLQINPNEEFSKG